MGGKYPTSCPGGHCGCECNFCAKYNNGGMDHVTASAAAAFTFDNMPPEVKIIFSGFVRSRTLPIPHLLRRLTSRCSAHSAQNVGDQVHTGGSLEGCAPASNPCRAAYINYCATLPHGCTD